MVDCIFCKMSNREVDVDVIYENEGFFSIRDINPISEGHSLIISKKHFENILDLSDLFGSELIDCVKGTFFELKKEFNFSGFNLVQNNFESAGQVVGHFHVHLVPRRKDDFVKLN